MALAYIVSAYRYPEQLERMVRALEPDSAWFLIHVDRRTRRAVFAEMQARLADFERVRFLPRHPSPWGGFGHVQASLEGMAAVVEERLECDHAVLLTGQDYPIKSSDHIRGFLAQQPDRSFIEHFAIPARERWHEIRGGLDLIG